MTDEAPTEVSEPSSAATVPDSAGNGQYTPSLTDLKVTALHLAIDHSRQNKHGAGEIVEIAERFWQWLKKEL